MTNPIEYYVKHQSATAGQNQICAAEVVTYHAPSKSQVAVLFDVQTIDKGASVSQVGQALAAATNNLLQPVLTSLRRMPLGKYSQAIAAVMVAQPETREFVKGAEPKTLLATAHNMYVDVSESKQYQVIASEGNRVRIMRPSSLETPEDIVKMLNGRRNHMRAVANNVQKAVEKFRESKLAGVKPGMLVSFVNPSNQLDLGFVANAFGNPRDPGEVTVAISSMVGVANKPVHVPAAMIVDVVDAASYTGQVQVPATVSPAFAATASGGYDEAAVVEYYNLLRKNNPDLFQRWLGICTDKGINVPMFE